MSTAIGSRAGMTAAAVLACGWLAMLAISWPGHLSYDSIIQLHDGRVGFYHSWHPPAMAWLLGVGDAILPGAGLFVGLDASLLFAALISLLWIAPRASWLAVCVAGLCVVSPQFLLYQAIVWKDVLFADSALAGFVCLAHAEARWTRGRFAWIAAAFALFVLAALTRQNGLVVVAVGAAALGIVAARSAGWKIGVLYAGAAVLCSLLAVFAMSAALSRHSDHGEGPVAQLKLLRMYDLIGAVAAAPSLPLDRLEGDAPDLARLMRSDGVRLYTPERNDTLVGSQALQNALGDAAPALMAAQWNDLVFRRTWLYLKIRARVFGWVFFTPDSAACRPVFTGVEGPAGEMGDLGLTLRRDARDLALANYAKAFMGTPVLSHAAYAVLALFASILFLWRRRPGDIAMAFLPIAALAFTASFFAVSIACDYRYLYFLDVAALASVFYLALDPAYLFQVLAMWVLSFWEERSALRKS